MGGWMDGWVDGWVDGWMDAYIKSARIYEYDQPLKLDNIPKLVNSHE